MKQSYKDPANRIHPWMSEEVKKQVKVRLEREQTEGISNAAARIYAKNGVKKGKEA